MKKNIYIWDWNSPYKIIKCELLGAFRCNPRPQFPYPIASFLLCCLSTAIHGPANNVGKLKIAIWDCRACVSWIFLDTYVSHREEKSFLAQLRESWKQFSTFTWFIFVSLHSWHVTLRHNIWDRGIFRDLRGRLASDWLYVSSIEIYHCSFLCECLKMDWYLNLNFSRRFSLFLSRRLLSSIILIYVWFFASLRLRERRVSSWDCLADSLNI